VIRPGDVQRMSAGRGVMHSEFNHAKTETTHFLQIWIQPDRTGIDPSYEEKRFEAADKRGRLRLVASPDGGDGSVVIHQNARVYAGTFDGDETAVLQVGAGRRAYIHVARGDVAVNGQKLGAGDAVMLTDEPSAALADGRAAEVLAFDLP
jgi:redox-sensitive bicupin YhaK (pirin superfamily)